MYTISSFISLVIWLLSFLVILLTVDLQLLSFPLEIQHILEDQLSVQPITRIEIIQTIKNNIEYHDQW